jgi:hypothetical protein
MNLNRQRKSEKQRATGAVVAATGAFRRAVVRGEADRHLGAHTYQHHERQAINDASAGKQFYLNVGPQHLRKDFHPRRRPGVPEPPERGWKRRGHNVSFCSHSPHGRDEKERMAPHIRTSTSVRSAPGAAAAHGSHSRSWHRESLPAPRPGRRTAHG